MDAVAPPHRRNTAPSAARLELRNGKWEIDRFELPTAASRHHLLLRLLGRRQRGGRRTSCGPPSSPRTGSGSATHDLSKRTGSGGERSSCAPPQSGGAQDEGSIRRSQLPPRQSGAPPPLYGESSPRPAHSLLCRTDATPHPGNGGSLFLSSTGGNEKKTTSVCGREVSSLMRQFSSFNIQDTCPDYM